MWAEYLDGWPPRFLWAFAAAVLALILLIVRD